MKIKQWAHLEDVPVENWFPLMPPAEIWYQENWLMLRGINLRGQPTLLYKIECHPSGVLDGQTTLNVNGQGWRAFGTEYLRAGRR